MIVSTDDPEVTAVAEAFGAEVPFVRPPELSNDFAGTTEVIARDPDPGNGYRREIAEVARCLNAGEMESPLIPLDETVAILEVLDEARRQLGVRYPEE